MELTLNGSYTLYCLSRGDLQFVFWDGVLMVSSFLICILSKLIIIKTNENTWLLTSRFLRFSYQFNHIIDSTRANWISLTRTNWLCLTITSSYFRRYSRIWRRSNWWINIGCDRWVANSYFRLRPGRYWVPRSLNSTSTRWRSSTRDTDPWSSRYYGSVWDFRSL